MRNFPALIGFLLLCSVPALIGGLSAPGDWYASLRKPSWNPPGWVFGPVWTALYLMMAVAGWRVWTRGGWAQQRGPLLLFVTQLGLNAAWTPLFFGWRQPGWAFAEILVLWLAIVLTVVAFFKTDKTAGWLLVPYLVWVSFASVLNGVLWRLNA
jgi:tryptophan-rich sensory protein